jgi:hypothetical protein
MNSSSPMPDLLPYQAQPTVGPPVPLAHRTVQCDQQTIGAGHVSPADCAADRWRRRLWLTGQSGAHRERRVRRWASLGTGQSGAPQAGAGLAELSHFFSNSISFDLARFLALR